MASLPLYSLATVPLHRTLCSVFIPTTSHATISYTKPRPMKVLKDYHWAMETWAGWSGIHQTGSKCRSIKTTCSINRTRKPVQPYGAERGSTLIWAHRVLSGCTSMISTEDCRSKTRTFRSMQKRPSWRPKPVPGWLPIKTSGMSGSIPNARTC